MTSEDELLLEQVTSAFRARAADGRVKSHPAWHDLGREGRAEAFEATLRLRRMEQALDAEGNSSTVAAVLERIIVQPK